MNAKEMEISAEFLKMDAFTGSFCNSLDKVKTKTEEAAKLRAKLRDLKTILREAEDDFVKVLGVKTKKEARQVEMKELISATRSRVEELRKTIEIKKRRRNEYRDAVSNLQRGNIVMDHEYTKKNDIQEANIWYKKVLGLQIDSGRGVKFSFNKIDENAPYAEYTFTVRLDDNTYTLLACDPQLDGSKELVTELNRTNGLYEFVRKMRQKFQDAALLGYVPEHSIEPNTITVTASAPESSMSAGGSGSTDRVRQRVQNSTVKKNRGEGSSPVMSRMSTRSSSRSKDIKH